MPSAGTGTKDDPLYWNETGQAQEGYFYIDLPSTGGEYESGVDAWVYGKFEQGQSYDFRAVAMEWGLEIKIYDAENNQVASGHFDDMEYELVLDFEPEATGIYYFHITCDWAMGEPKIGVNPAPVAITPYIERSKGKAETLGFNEQGRAILYNSIKAANLGLKTVVYAAGYDIPTGSGYENSNTFKPLEFLGKLLIKVFSVYGKRYAYILEDGSLWTFGENNNGHGNNEEEIFMPRQIEGEWQDVSVGSAHSIATDKDGNVWGWGRDYNYSLMGKGDLSKPTLLLNVNAKKIEAGYRNNTILTQDNDLYVWGYNNSGRLGLGHTNNVNTPIKHEGKYKDFALGYSSIFAISADGELFSAGYNNAGLLGLGDTDGVSTLTKVNDDTDWESVFAGMSSSIAIKTDKGIYGAGQRSFIGLGDVDHQKTFINLELNDVKTINTGRSTTHYIKTNGDIYGTGDNYYGQLGLGHTNEVKVFTKAPHTTRKSFAIIENPYGGANFILGRP